MGKGGGGGGVNRTVSQRQRGKRREKDGRRVSGGEENSREVGDCEKLKRRRRRVQDSRWVVKNLYRITCLHSNKLTNNKQAGVDHCHGKVTSLDLTFL